MKPLSNKEQKMSGKVTRSNQPSNSICWICHQESNFIESKELQECSWEYFRKQSRTFTPCLCKGSIGIVHQECLNKWASEKYKQATKTPPNGIDDLPVICCPNCKAPYEYTVYEMTKFKGFKSIKIISKESFWLFFLLVAQIFVLIYDVCFLSKSENSGINKEETPDTSEGVYFMELSKYLHIITVLIVIAAGIVNLLETVQKEIKVEVQSQF